jgi:hypothetical protein
MRACLALFLLLAALVETLAQEPDAVRANARRIVKNLTSPAFHGRGYVQQGDAIAADWIAKEYARLGLLPVKQDYFQPFHFKVNSFPDSVRVSIDGKRLIPGIDFLVDPASGKASGIYNVVHVELADLLDPARKAMTMGVLSGQAAYLRATPTTNGDTLRLYSAIERDLLFHCPVVRAARGKLTWGVSQEAFPFPLIEVAEGLLTDSIATLEVHVRNTVLDRHQARNVLGSVKGKGKKWIVIGAHYDHLGRMGPDVLFPGANDNASGVGGMVSQA